MKHKPVFPSAVKRPFHPLAVAFIALFVLITLAVTFLALSGQNDIRSRASDDSVSCPSGTKAKTYADRVCRDVNTKKGTKRICQTLQKTKCIMMTLDEQ